MSRDVSADLAKLCALAALVAVGVAVGVAPLVGVLGLLALALVSPAGPTVLFDEVGG